MAKDIAQIMERGSKLEKLFSPQERAALGAYLFDYRQTPSYKKTLSFMLKFSDMYRPISKGSMDMFRDTSYVDAINAERRERRAELYLAKKDLVLAYDEKSGKRLVVTTRGHKVFYDDFPLARLRREKWNEVWTVVMYDFPEKQRDQRRIFRQRLMSFGFGSPQISILISPLPIHEGVQKLVEGDWLEREVWVMRAKRILGMENLEVAQKAWPLDAINNLYKVLLRVFGEAEKKSLLPEWAEYFLAVDHADPYLPKELLPGDWLGWECQERFASTGRAGLLKALAARMRRSVKPKKG